MFKAERETGQIFFGKVQNFLLILHGFKP